MFKKLGEMIFGKKKPKEPVDKPKPTQPQPVNPIVPNPSKP